MAAVTPGDSVDDLDGLFNRIADDAQTNLDAAIALVNGRLKSGTKTVSVPAGSTIYTGTVTFTTPFASRPYVTVTPTTGRPDAVFASTNGRTASDFNYAVCNNVGAFDITFHWIAVL